MGDKIWQNLLAIIVIFPLRAMIMIRRWFELDWDFDWRLRPSRLETRTEESGVCASGINLNYAHKMKVNCIKCFYTLQHGFDWVEVHILGPERLWIIPGLVEVRGNSDGRSPTVLTCKSLVRAGYRGERPIEQSGSWFPPKFLSG